MAKPPPLPCLVLFFEGAAEDATIVVGGLFKNIASNIRIGASEYFVTEADESDGSFFIFLRFSLALPI